MGITVSIDVGFGHTKVSFKKIETGSELVLIGFPSALLHPSNYDRTRWFPKPISVVESGTENLMSGDDIFVIDSNRIMIPELNLHFATTTLYRDLLIAALARQPHQVIDNLILALPLLTFRSHAGYLRESFAGKFNVSRTRTVLIKNVVVKAQGVAGAIGVVDPDIAPKIIGFDLGSFSMDVFEINDGEFSTEDCKSYEVGIYRLAQEAQSKMPASMGVLQNNLDLHKLRSILSGAGTQTVGNQRLDFLEVIKYSPTTISEITRILRKHDKPNASLIAIGGGNRVIEHILRGQRDRFIPVLNPAFSNVIGMMES
jgi:hypothetical protein